MSPESVALHFFYINILVEIKRKMVSNLKYEKNHKILKELIELK